MPLGTTTAGFKAAVENQAYQRVVKVTITLPVVGTLTFGAAPLGALQGLTFEEGDQSSYPSDLIDQSGLTNVAGSVTLGGKIMVAGSPVTVTRLFNPNDAASPLYQQELDEAPITVSAGVVKADGTTELVDRAGYVTTIDVQQSQGLVVVNWSDVPAGFEALPALNAVLVAPPYNAGLTSEFVMDRIARAASSGAVSSWPAQRANCVLAVGMRSSLWPELGKLRTDGTFGNPIFGTGPYGSGVKGFTSPTIHYVPYDLAATVGADMYVEWLFSGLQTGGSTLVTVADSISENQVVFLQVFPDRIEVTWERNGVDDLFTWTVATDSATHYVGFDFHMAIGSNQWSVTIYLDGVSHSSGTRTAGTTRSLTFATALLSANAPVTLAGVQVTAETSPTPNNAFTPRAVFDPSLNPLQAVPAIDAGANAYDELQAVAEAEVGWIGFRDGVLTFLNRNTVSAQLASRAVTAQASMMDIESATVGGSTTYDDIAIDYTEYEFNDEAMVYTPKKAIKVAAHSTWTATRTLPDGLTVGGVDQSFTYASGDTLPDNIGVSNSVFRASLDRNGVNEIPDTSQLSGTVAAVTPSQIKISITNSSGADVWLVSPSNYTSIPVGTPSAWVNGLPVTPDDASVVHVNNGGATTSTYQAPSNGYRQDRDATIATGNYLLAMLSGPTVLYGSVEMVPDPRVTVPDRVTLDVPVDGGVTALDVFVWGNTLTGSFDADGTEWSQQLDVRAVAPAGAWVLGRSVLATSTYIY